MVKESLFPGRILENPVGFAGVRVHGDIEK
jgi:hypothetical protein